MSRIDDAANYMRRLQRRQDASMPADPTPTRADEQEREVLAKILRMADDKTAMFPSYESMAGAILSAGFRRPEPVREAACGHCEGTGSVEVADTGFAAHLGEPRTVDEPCPKCAGTGRAQPEPQQQGGEGNLRGVLKIARDCIRMHDEGQPVPWAGLARMIDAALAALAPAASAVTDAFADIDRAIEYADDWHTMTSNAFIAKWGYEHIGSADRPAARFRAARDRLAAGFRRVAAEPAGVTEAMVAAARAAFGCDRPHKAYRITERDLRAALAAALAAEGKGNA